MMIAALDISKSGTGICWGDGDSRPETRVQSFEGEGPVVLRDFQKWLSKLLRDQIKPDMIVIEAALLMMNDHASAKAARLLLELAGVAKATSSLRGVRDDRIIEVSVKTWRKTELGSGNLPGPEAKNRALEKCADLNWLVEDHNAAESAMIWAHAHKYIEGGNQRGLRVMLSAVR